MSQAFDNVVKLRDIFNVRNFGAKGDGTTDDSAAIQAAINFAFASGEPFPKVLFPRGNYLVNTQIDRSGDGNYVDLIGDGQRETIITAGAAMSSVFYLAAPTDTTGRTLISGMTIRCENLADRAIDAENMRYWTLTNVEIYEALVAGIRCGNWLTRILNNSFNECPIGVEVDGIDAAPSSANNLLIMQNNFSTCTVGCQVQSRSNDIKIEYNAFDVCAAAGVWVREGGRSITIDKNYFEKCGKDATVSVPIDTNPANNVNRGAAIIINHQTGSPTQTTWTGQILDNFFADCNTDRYIVLTNVERGYIDQNDIYGTPYTLDAFVEILGFGCYTTCKEFVLKGSYDSTQCDRICELNGLDPEDSYRNMVINNTANLNTELAYFAANDPTSNFAGWTGATTINTTAYQGTFKEFEYDVVGDGSNIQRNLSITLENASNIRGRFMRVTYATKGSSVSSGVWVQILIDGSVVASFTRTATDYVSGANNSVFFVPSNATTLLIRTRGVSSSNNAKMVGFCVSDAAFGLREAPIARLDRNDDPDPVFNSVTVNGNVVLSNGSGIDFSATPGTGTSELFDDYEEGTFTPELEGIASAGTYTYAARSGVYTKIGDLVTVSIALEDITESAAGSGGIKITGLPFASNGLHVGTVWARSVDFDASAAYLVSYTSTAAEIYLQEVEDNGTGNVVNVADIVSGSSKLYINLTYKV